MSLRVFFIGNVEMSAELIGVLKNDTRFTISGVLTKKTSTFNSDHCDLSKCDLPESTQVFYDDDIDVSQNKLKQIFESLSIDILFCFGWSKLIKLEVLELVNLISVGFHPAELPRNRGRHPIIWAKVLGLKTTASTFFELKEDEDSGKILSQVKIKIDDADSARDLYEKIKIQAKNQLKEILDRFYANDFSGKPQNKFDTNHWRKRSKNDGVIDWRMSAKNIRNLILALSEPYPGATFLFQGHEIKVFKCTKESFDFDFSSFEPGKILKRYKDGFLIMTGSAPIRIYCDTKLIPSDIKYV